MTYQFNILKNICQTCALWHLDIVFIKSKVSHFHFLIKSPASNCHRMMDYVFAHDREFRLYILSKFMVFINKEIHSHRTTNNVLSHGRVKDSVYGPSI